MSLNPAPKPHGLWKYFGAMMMEEKSGHQAVSFTRMLGVITFTVWIALITLQAAGVGSITVPTELTIAMGSFAGLKSLEKFAPAKLIPGSLITRKLENIAPGTIE